MYVRIASLFFFLILVRQQIGPTVLPGYPSRQRLTPALRCTRQSSNTNTIPFNLSLFHKMYCYGLKINVWFFNTSLQGKCFYKTFMRLYIRSWAVLLNLSFRPDRRHPTCWRRPWDLAKYHLIVRGQVYEEDLVYIDNRCQFRHVHHSIQISKLCIIFVLRLEKSWTSNPKD